MKKTLGLVLLVVVATLLFTYRADSQLYPGLTNGPTPFYSNAVTAAATVQSSAGTVYSYSVENPGTASGVLEFYNATQANVTLGTTTPIWVVPLPYTSSAPPYGANLASPAGIFSFTTALSVACETTFKSGSTCATGVQVDVGTK